jgi:Family of unknown function (DUF5681)
VAKGRTLKIVLPLRKRRRKLKPERAKQLAAAGRPYWFKKGVSGNPGGKPKGFKEMAVTMRQLAMSDPTLDEIIRILFNRKRPDLQVSVWREILSRGFGQAPQAVYMKAMINENENIGDGSGREGLKPRPYVVDADDPEQMKRAVEVTRQLIALGFNLNAGNADEQRAADDATDVTPTNGSNGRNGSVR